MSSTYKLSESLYGHTSDVRTIAPIPDGGFLSGSRDLSAKLWSKESLASSHFVTTTAFTGHSNFVASVCYLAPSTKYPEGVVVTGSNDNKIRLFNPTVSSAFKILSEHTNTVCKLCPGSYGWSFLSASWDQTARGWREEGDQWISATFSGHTMAVWAVCQLSSGLVVTASADRTLRVFGESGDLQRKLEGHSDCVRDVVCATDDQVISVANDASIRHWNVLSGECLNTYYGHGHYIYAIAMIPGLGWVTSSEDKTVKVWNSEGEVDSLTLPCESVWTVTVLPNSDIVAGSNDGVIRIFTRSAERVADAHTLAAYQVEVNKVSASAALNVGGVKVSELPGPDALLEPGRSDGQTNLVREGNTAVAYSWSAEEGTWQKIGDVVGAAENAAGQTGRPSYNGKEYDFVFNVDIEDGKPSIKLPYNRNEDPWQAAQKFIHNNDLPQTYLEQVANFIITNAGQAPAPVVQPEFVDPFTGGNRYVPGSSSTTTGTSSKPSKTSLATVHARHFPQREFVRFTQGNLFTIRDKILLLNNDNNLGEDEDVISTMLCVCQSEDECTPAVLVTLQTLLAWPSDIVFPVLDVLRLMIRKESAAEYFCSDQFLKDLEKHLQVSPNNMLAIRTCCNMMSTRAGEQLAAKHRLTLIEFLMTVPSPYSKHLQVAMATLLLNLSVLIHRSETPDGRNEALLAGRELLPVLDQDEAVFRALVAMGTLVADSSNRGHYLEPLRPLLVKHSASNASRIRDTANDIMALVQV